MNNKLWSFGTVGLLIGLLVGQFVHRNDFINGQLRACNDVIAPSVASGTPMKCVVTENAVLVDIDLMPGVTLTYTLGGKRIK